MYNETLICFQIYFLIISCYSKHKILWLFTKTALQKVSRFGIDSLGNSLAAMILLFKVAQLWEHFHLNF